MTDRLPPTLEEQMQAQARIRGNAMPKDSEAFGCLSLAGIVMMALMAWLVVSGAALAWWMWLTW